MNRSSSAKTSSIADGHGCVDGAVILVYSAVIRYKLRTSILPRSIATAFCWRREYDRGGNDH
jgi:hypothetical protein